MLDTELDALYESGARQVKQAVERYKLVPFIEALKKTNFLTVSSFYGDRSDWSIIQQSRFIESFLLNIPVPRITLWKIGEDCYELLDGRRRVNALREFYGNRFKLDGLESFAECNGRTYREMPQLLRSKLNRHSLETIAVIADSITPEDALKIKRLTFDRLHQND